MGARSTVEKTSLSKQPVPPVTLSLFSGAGGLDIGFLKAGFDIVGCVEIEEAFCKTLEANKGRYSPRDCQIFNLDARLFTPSRLAVSKVDFIIGGPPCQSFSAIGRRAGGARGIDDHRGSLFEEYCRLVAHYQPIGFLFENVRGIISSNQGKDWLEIKSAFEKIGYELTYRILSSADYGVPQKRERLILVGTRVGYTYQFPLPTHGADSQSKQDYVSAYEAIKDLQDPDEPYHAYSGRYGKLLGEVPPGQNYHFFTSKMGYPKPVFAWRSRFSDFLYKAHPDEPVRIVVAKLGKYSGPFHWKNRRFTVAEMKRLQGFPDDYSLEGTKALQMQQLGNSVPPIFAEQLAKSVLKSLFHQQVDVELMSEHFAFSFDKEKGKRAKKTRHKMESYPLFTDMEETTENSNVQKAATPSFVKQTKFVYVSPKVRHHIESQTSEEGNCFTISTHRDGTTCFINVSASSDLKQHPKLKYELLFHRPVGDGLKAIICESTIPGECLYVVWDAIEDCLKHFTSYQTMFDIYGHFTEPHPIFDLKAELPKGDDSLLNFAYYFSDMANNRQVFHRKVLAETMGISLHTEGEFIELVKHLRSLRFDVRVSQTNAKIPPNYFRCCYPFTLSLNRQVSITWSDQLPEQLVAV